MRFKGRFGQRVRGRLRREKVLWLTSVDARRMPQPRPVWFHWDGRDLLIYSRPRAGKIRQIQANPHVAAHFNSTAEGDDVVVLLGEARVVKGPIPKARRRAYLRKYRQGIRDLEMTPSSFLADYRVALRIRLTALRGF